MRNKNIMVELYVEMEVSRMCKNMLGRVDT